MAEKHCPRCGTTKSTDEFSKNKARANRDGLASYCKSCVREYGKQKQYDKTRWENNREHEQQRHKDYMARDDGTQVTTNARAAYSDELIDEMLDRVSGGESLNSLCREDGMPARQTFFRWVTEKPGLREKYELALSLRADWVFDEILDIADEPVGATDNGSTDSGAVAKQKLQVDARKWVLSKMSPKKYGDKLDIDMNSNVTTMTEEQRLARIAELHAKMFV